MSLLYFIISCEDLRPPLYIRFRHALFSYVVVDIMYDSFFFCFISYMRRFGFGFVQPEIGIISYCLIFPLFLLTCCVNIMDEGWNDVKYREITCILNFTKGKTKNIIDLPPSLRLIDMKIISLSNHASCYLYCCLYFLTLFDMGFF